MMYDTDDPPQRRIYANGYYSGWFSVKSGVAQGCPLSPLLFLVIGQMLKVSLGQNSWFKGVKVGERYVKAGQFADDTTLYLGGPAELPHAEKQVGVNLHGSSGVTRGRSGAHEEHEGRKA